MGIASLIIGIISVLVSFIPLCNYFALIPAIVALILGIVGIVSGKKKEQGIGVSIAGTIVSAIAIIIIVVWTIVLGAAGKKAANEIDANALVNDIFSNYEFNYELDNTDYDFE